MAPLRLTVPTPGPAPAVAPAGPPPLWVVVVAFGHREVHLLMPPDSLLPVYDRASAGVVAWSVMSEALERGLVPGKWLTALFLDRSPGRSLALAATGYGYEEGRHAGGARVLGAMQCIPGRAAKA